MEESKQKNKDGPYHFEALLEEDPDSHQRRQGVPEKMMTDDETVYASAMDLACRIK